MYRIVQIQRKLCTYVNGLSGIAKKFEDPEFHKFKGELCTLDVRIVWICKNFNYTNTLNEQNLVNSTRNCVHWMYRLFGIVENVNIQKCVNSTRNCVH